MWNSLVGLEYSLRAEGSPGAVAGEQCLQFADDLLGRGFRDQSVLDLELERRIEERWLPLIRIHLMPEGLGPARAGRALEFLLSRR